jgi:hypothetical protein
MFTIESCPPVVELPEVEVQCRHPDPCVRYHGTDRWSGSTKCQRKTPQQTKGERETHAPARRSADQTTDQGAERKKVRTRGSAPLGGDPAVRIRHLAGDGHPGRIDRGVDSAITVVIDLQDHVHVVQSGEPHG